MLKKVVVLQPMFLPWIGVFEQIKLSDVYVHFDDVQYPIGRSFMNRVQIKTCQGIQWLTAPVKRKGIQSIESVVFDNSQNWKEKHLRTIRESYKKAKNFEEMMDIVEEIYSIKTENICEFNINSIELISKYFEIQTEFKRASELNVLKNVNASEKLVDIVKKNKGNIYITGHGAKNYIDYDLFEKNGLNIEYMEYRCNKYIQLYGEFSPYVSIIDLIANEGRLGLKLMNSKSIYWKDLNLNKFGGDSIEK